MSERVLNLLLTHQRADRANRMLTWWARYLRPEDLLVAYTGSAEEYERIAHPQKIAVTDPRIETRDHQKDLQSYTKVWAAAAAWLQAEDPQAQFTHVHFAEYDQLPLTAGINIAQLARLRSEQADVLGYSVHRADGTNSAHYLYHAREKQFHEFWRSITCRRDPHTVLSMFGTGSFWTREAFLQVASLPEPFPMYLELYLPTLAHHFGFRVRDFGEQSRFILSVGDRIKEIDAARAQGAWSIHPVKSLWEPR